MSNLLQKPTIQGYRNVMIPHILPLRANQAGITPDDKLAWGKLAAEVRKEVETRYSTATAEELLHDMSFKRHNQRQKNQKRERVLTKGERLRKAKGLYAKYIVIDDPKESGKIIESLPECSDNLRLWIKGKREKWIKEITTIEMTVADCIARLGQKIIMKMPFVAAGHVYVSSIYIPTIKVAIDIVSPFQPKLTSDKRQDEKKTLNLKKIGITRFKISKSEVNDPEALEFFVSKIIKSSI